MTGVTAVLLLSARSLKQRGCCNDHGWIALESVARLGIFERAEKCGAEYDKEDEKADAEGLASTYKSRHAERNIGQVDQAKCETEREPAVIVIEFPPARVGRKEFGARPQPHIGNAHGWKPDIIAEWGGVYSPFCQCGEARVEFR